MQPPTPQVKWDTYKALVSLRAVLSVKLTVLTSRKCKIKARKLRMYSEFKL